MAQKFGIEFDEFKKLEKQLRELAGFGGLMKATENALIATKDYVTAEVDKAVANSPYNFDRSGTTKQSIDRDKTVKWSGTEASVDVGFRISKGGLPSIFLMYGTPKSEHPIKPDTNLYNAVKGKGQHAKKIREIQQEEFNKVISEVMNNG